MVAPQNTAWIEMGPLLLLFPSKKPRDAKQASSDVALEVPVSPSSLSPNCWGGGQQVRREGRQGSAGDEVPALKRGRQIGRTILRRGALLGGLRVVSGDGLDAAMSSGWSVLSADAGATCLSPRLGRVWTQLPSHGGRTWDGCASTNIPIHTTKESIRPNKCERTGYWP
jgi:hypothetical protein